MKTTLELPDDLFRSTKVVAAAQGRPLMDLIADAVREKLARIATHHGPPEAPWIKFFGPFGKSAAAHADNKRTLAAVNAEFGQSDALE